MISAGKISVLIGRKKRLPKMLINIKRNGYGSRIASWRMLDLTVPLMRDKTLASQAIFRGANSAIVEDMAETVVLGCTGLIRQAIETQKKLNIPILDPVLCRIKVTEMRAILQRSHNISYSKIGGYKVPPQKSLRNYFKIFTLNP